MNILSPSILAADFTKLGEQIREVEAAGAAYLHIDVMDGLFVPSISFGMPLISSIRKCTKMTFDVHLMIQEPIRYIREFAACGADIITFHVEATEKVSETIAAIRENGCRVGISVKPGTPLSEIEPYLSMVDMVLVMTVEPGFGGQKYMHDCTEKVRQVREMLTQKGYAAYVEIDGGVTAENIGEPLAAGANVIVAGSAVFKGDPGENVKRLLGKMQA